MRDIHIEEIWVKIIIFIIGLVIFLTIFAPIIKPAINASDISNDLNVYKKIFNKSNSVIEVEMNNVESDDENKKELFSILFKYLTNIDLGNPKSYIASQIPLLNLLDITLISSNEEGPVIVVPRITDSTGNVENNSNSNNSTANNSTQPGKTSEGQNVTPGKTIPVKSRKLDTTKPLILIYHTHTTESYNPENIDGKYYSTDSNENVVRIGEELKKELETKYGIAVVHDTTVYNIPKIEGAYQKSRPDVSKYLKKYPSLIIAMDIHRDGFDKSVSQNLKGVETALIGNEKYARVMFVVGTSYKNYNKNDVLVTKINNTFNYYYPKFSRGLYFRKGIFNQDLSSKVILMELGSSLNSLSEALNSVKVIAKVLSLSIK